MDGKGEGAEEKEEGGRKEENKEEQEERKEGEEEKKEKKKWRERRALVSFWPLSNSPLYSNLIFRRKKRR
jgi:hypothetical protein